MRVAAKGTLLIVSGPAHDPQRKHLHVVCNDPDAEGNVLLVGIASLTDAAQDTTCILQAHEHSFLRHASYVFYARAMVMSAASLIAGQATGVVVEREVLNAQTFLRIVNGICRSPRTRNDIRRYRGCDEAAELP